MVHKNYVHCQQHIVTIFQESTLGLQEVSENSDEDCKVDVTTSTPKVSGFRSKPDCFNDTTVEQGNYAEMTTTESGNTVVFKTSGKDEDSNDSENSLFNVSPVDDGDISEEDDRSKKRKLSDSEGAPLAKSICTHQENISEKVESEERKEKTETVDDGLEKDENMEDLQNLGFIPPARAGQARGPVENISEKVESYERKEKGEGPEETVDNDLEEVENMEDVENLGFFPPARADREPVEVAQPNAKSDVEFPKHLEEMPGEDSGNTIVENGDTQVEVVVDNQQKVGEAKNKEKQSKLAGSDGGNQSAKSSNNKHNVFDFVEDDLAHAHSAKDQTKQTEQRTPPQEYKARRQPKIESEWREIGGVTPEEGDKRGKKDLKVLEFLVHQLAVEEGIDLSKEQLRENFFMRLVNKYGNVSGSTRMAGFKTSAYPLRLWRENFCVKEKTKFGKVRAGPHLFQYPQESETPCRLCNQQTEEHMGGPDQAQLLSANSTTQDESHDCKHCQKHFKTLKILRQHIKKFHAKEASSEMEEKGTKGNKCDRCGKADVGDLQRHAKEFCRSNKENLAECPHCKGMIVKTKLKEHIQGWVNKATGKKVKKGCKDKFSSDDKIPEMETCAICLKSFKKTYALQHMRKFHKEMHLSKSKPDQDEVKKPAKHVFSSREEYLAALERADLEEATRRSMEEPKPHQQQGMMVDRGLDFMMMLGLHLEPPPTFAPRDGNCSMSSIAIAENPGLGVIETHTEATHLRQGSIAALLQQIRTMDEASLERVRLIATPETSYGEQAVSLTREDLIERLERYADDGEYAGNLGDIIVYALANFTRAPILVVDVNHENRPLGLFVSPRTLFGVEPVTNVPYVMVRHANHFNPLMVPEKARIPLQEMFAAEEGPSKEICATTSCSNVEKEQGGSGEQGGSMPVQASQDADTLPAPSSTQGDRKRLLSFLRQLAPQFEQQIRELLKQLDSQFVQSPLTIREMEESQQEIQVLPAPKVCVFSQKSYCCPCSS